MSGFQFRNRLITDVRKNVIVQICKLVGGMVFRLGSVAFMPDPHCGYAGGYLS